MEWNEEWNNDLDMLKDQLEAAYADGDAQFYADSDVPSDVEFSGACERHDHQDTHSQRRAEHSLHNALVAAEDMVINAIHSCKPTGFPFHHFPETAKKAIDFFAPPKRGTP
jgi:hypothetical protein